MKTFLEIFEEYTIILSFESISKIFRILCQSMQGILAKKSINYLNPSMVTELENYGEIESSQSKNSSNLCSTHKNTYSSENII